MSADSDDGSLRLQLREQGSRYLLSVVDVVLTDGRLHGGDPGASHCVRQQNSSTPYSHMPTGGYEQHWPKASVTTERAATEHTAEHWID